MIKARSLESFLLHFIAFLLLWEWLRPIEALGEIAFISLFILFIGLCFLFYFFSIPTVVKLIVGIVYIITAINYMFFEKSLLATLLPMELIGDIFSNIGKVLQGDFLTITNPFRTLLLFTLLWMIVYLLHYWIIVRKKMFFFLLLTIVYLSVIDTFAPYNAQNAILRAFAVGLIGIGIVNFFRLVDREQLQIAQLIKNKYLLILCGVTFLSTSIGVLVPKAGPQWEDPIPYLQSFATHHLSQGSGGKIGYDEDDSRLGGPFKADDTVVFRVSSEEEEYWRVETKDYYTGKGWELSARNVTVDIDVASGVVQVYSAEEAYLEEELSVSVDMVGTKSHIIYPHGVQQLHFPGVDDGDVYTFNYVSEKFSARFFKDIQNYDIVYRKPRFEIYSLKKTKDSRLFNPEFLERYTQLPDSLPERVIDLAKELTAGDDNWYDKAKSIENYLHSHLFTYETEDVPVPKGDEDYVDQFLFETRRGYCDNFSTSMVVLLRAIGIPARWVKGYTPGEVIETTGDNQIFEVTNNNAHSWVEVYFPNVGWVPFEPTKSFSSPATFYYDLANIPSNEEPEEEEKDEEDTTTPVENEPQTPEMPEEEPSVAPSSPEDTAKAFSFKEFFEKYQNVLWWSLAGVALLALLLLIFRRKWYPYWLIHKYRKKTDRKSFEEAYLALLTQLNWNGFTMKEGETLRSFAAYIDELYGNSDMTLLTNQYERIIYGSKKEGQDFSDQIKKSWEQMLRRLLGKTS